VGRGYVAEAWAERLRLLHAAFRREESRFDGSYCSEVTAKFVAASAEVVDAAAACPADSQSQQRPSNDVRPLGAEGQALAGLDECHTNIAGLDDDQRSKWCLPEEEEEGEEDEEEGFEIGGSYDDGDGDVLDEALDAMLQAERTGGSRASHFTDDYDVLAHRHSSSGSVVASREGGHPPKRAKCGDV
jgi:hypothetical protein